MSKEIETEKIYLDTTVFIAENFFKGIKLNALLKHAKEQEIELYITEITLEETLSNIEKEFRHGKNLFKKAVKTLSSRAKILKNVNSMVPIFQLDEDFDTEKELEILKNRFRELVDENFKVIPIDPNKTLKIIKDYFKENPPFKEGGKKFEFPDAFVLNSLESWCKKQNERMYILSGDGDIISYKSKRLLPVEEFDKLLNQISYTYSKKNIMAKVEETIKLCEKEITEKVKEEFEEEFPTEGLDTNYGYEYYLNSLEEIKLEYVEHSILSVYDNEAIVEVSYKGQYSAEVGYEDLSSGFYDKEDDVYYGATQANQIVSDNLDLTVELKVHVALPGKPAIWDWELEGIMDGIPDYVSLE